MALPPLHCPALTASACAPPIATFDPDGVICGKYVVETVGLYGFMPIYRDDSLIQEDEGANQGDTLTFKIWDATSQEYLTPTSNPSTVTWTTDGDQFRVDLAANLEFIISLRLGWILVGQNANRVWHTGDAPTVDLLDRSELVDLDPDNIDQSPPQKSIEGIYQSVRCFDATGGHSFDSNLPAFSDLHDLATGHGLWIRTDEEIPEFRWPTAADLAG